ncbi:MAG: DUF1599 domain-containing protein [Bacteroidetes bacterium]|nr:DUF1599 domain-containing protein [Bacteroidota bacterium]
MDKTILQYNQIISQCRDLFAKKTQDYGTAWRILRTSSLTDQIFIKAQRIRTLEQIKESKVGEGIHDEFVGIVNYSIMALIQLESHADISTDWSVDQALQAYQHQAENTLALMMKKNHDYGEAWRDMRVSSFTDLILMKLLRIKQIEDNAGKTIVSEGIDSGYQDILNYAVFALIQMSEQK